MQKTKIGIITCQKFPDLHAGEQEFVSFLDAQQFEIYPIVWTNPIHLAEMDVLLFRSCWDYHTQITDFQAFLNKVEELKIPTWNPLSIVRQNLHKFYLRDLAQKGIPIIPTQFLSKGEITDIQALIRKNNWDKAVVKPSISASSTNTQIISQETSKEEIIKFHNLLKNNDLLLQKFIPEIATVGEVSIIFFANGFQYNILKNRKQVIFEYNKSLGEVPNWSIYRQILFLKLEKYWIVLRMSFYLRE